MASSKPTRTPSLWRDGDFLKVWAGQGVSALGSEVTGFALPIVAVVTLHARPAEVGLLIAIRAVCGLLVGLVAGAWVDRLPRRPILVVADLASAAVIGSIPVAAAVGALTLGQLYVVYGVFGLLRPFFWTSFEAYLPSLVRTDQLMDANGKFAATESGAAVVGPGVGGSLVALLTAPLAMAADALSFVASATSVALVRAREAAPETLRTERRLVREIREGFAVTFRDPGLRWVALFHTARMVGALVYPLYALFALRVLGLSPLSFGLIGTIGALGFVVGSIIGPRAARRFGTGPTMVVSSFLLLVSPFFMPFAPAHSAIAVVLLTAAAVIGAAGDVTITVITDSYRQAITPSRFLGRVVATSYFLVGVAFLLGPLVGGFLGQAVGIRRTILVAACLHAAFPVVVWFSPLRRAEFRPDDEQPRPPP